MPAKKRPGVTGIYFEVPDEDVARLDALIERLPLGNRADHLRLALRRHLDAPPTVAVPDTPPVAVPPVEPPAPKKPRAKKGERKPQ
jgi:hypothetical protein